jgi:hypothetical protein
MQVDECFLESLLDDVFSVFPNPRVAERQSENPSPVAFEEGFKRQFISAPCGSDEFFIRSGITERSDASFAPVWKLTQHDFTS